MASRRNGTLYIGVTNDVARRAWEHRNGLVPGFTKKYGVTMLVHFEVFEDINRAIWRETRLKKWKRAWKLQLIEEVNPGWEDLYDRLVAGTLSATFFRSGNAARLRDFGWVARVRGP